MQIPLYRPIKHENQLLLLLGHITALARCRLWYSRVCAEKGR